jgi:phosphoribosylformylglycinamidine synthase
MKAAVIIFPGSNRERDVCLALERSTGRPPDLVWHRDTELPKTDLIVIPGGFAYGDYLRCGAMAAHSPIMREIKHRASRGTPVLGICNGFQVLTEAGMLPGVLLSNQTLKFHCRDVHLRVETSQTLFTAGYEQGQVIRVPVAHHDGNYFADPATLDRLEDKGLVAFRYCSPKGELTEADNHNGSARNIAGVFNDEKTVLGLMPHPEDATDELLGNVDGRGLFDGMARALMGASAA